MGLSAVTGLGEQHWQRIDQARSAAAFTSLEDLCRRTQLPRDAVTALIRAGVQGIIQRGDSAVSVLVQDLTPLA